MERKPKILYVDNDSINLTLFEFTFESQYDIKTSTDSYEAFEMLSKEQFDIIISDQQRPEMKGTDFLANIQQQNPTVAKVLLTAYADTEIEINENLAQLNYTHVQKPWKEDFLTEIIRQKI